MAFTQITVMLLSTTLALGQRPSFAGTRPIGFPDVVTTTTVNPLQDRFGEDSNITTTTERLPVEALGDRDLVDRLSKLPLDKQPFWFINWQALEAHRQKPQSYPQRPSQFAQPLAPDSNSVIVNTNSGGLNPNSNLGASVNTNPEIDNLNRNSGTTNDNTASANPNLLSASLSTITGGGASSNPTIDNINSGTTNDKPINTVANFILGNKEINSGNVNTNYKNSPNANNNSERPFVNLSTPVPSFDSASTNSNLQVKNTFSDSVLSNKKEIDSKESTSSKSDTIRAIPSPRNVKRGRGEVDDDYWADSNESQEFNFEFQPSSIYSATS